MCVSLPVSTVEEGRTDIYFSRHKVSLNLKTRLVSKMHSVRIRKFSITGYRNINDTLGVHDSLQLFVHESCVH